MSSLYSDPPADVVDGTRERYVEAFERITGSSFARYLADDSIGGVAGAER